MGRCSSGGDDRNPRGRRLMASQTPGAIAVEPVDLADLRLWSDIRFTDSRLYRDSSVHLPRQ